VNRRSLLQKNPIKETIFCKETYHFEEPTHFSHPIVGSLKLSVPCCMRICSVLYTESCVRIYKFREPPNRCHRIVHCTHEFATFMTSPTFNFREPTSLLCIARTSSRLS